MDQRTFDIDTQFMWGSSLIIAPIIEQGVSVRSVYLPESDIWYDLYSMTRIQGGDRMAVSNLDDPNPTVPVFVRSGSILPIQQPGTKSEMRRKKEEEVEAVDVTS